MRIAGFTIGIRCRCVVHDGNSFSITRPDLFRYTYGERLSMVANSSSGYRSKVPVFNGMHIHVPDLRALAAVCCDAERSLSDMGALVNLRALRRCRITNCVLI